MNAEKRRFPSENTEAAAFQESAVTKPAVTATPRERNAFLHEYGLLRDKSGAPVKAADANPAIELHTEPAEQYADLQGRLEGLSIDAKRAATDRLLQAIAESVVDVRHGRELLPYLLDAARARLQANLAESRGRVYATPEEAVALARRDMETARDQLLAAYRLRPAKRESPAATAAEKPGDAGAEAWGRAIKQAAALPVDRRESAMERVLTELTRRVIQAESAEVPPNLVQVIITQHQDSLRRLTADGHFDQERLARIFADSIRNAVRTVKSRGR
jgi:hypothetical protein